MGINADLYLKNIVENISSDLKMSNFRITASWTSVSSSFSPVPGGSYFDYVKAWDEYIDNENVMAISYEELKEVRATLTF